MPDFLSAEWVAALNERLAEGTQPRAATPVTVQYVVARDRDEVSYYLVLGPEGEAAHIGTAARADVTFTMGEATAQQISDGTLSSEEAFITGQLRLDGDATLLIAAHPDDA